MRDFFEEVMIPIGFILGIMFGFGLVLSVPILWIGKTQCAIQASKMDVPYSWGIFQDCMVQLDGKWMPLEAYKVVKLRP